MVRTFRKDVSLLGNSSVGCKYLFRCTIFTACQPAGAVQHEHFEHWIALFMETIDTHFEGIKADEAKWRAGKMAVMFESKINYLSKNTLKPLM
ncbi:globin family protein [Hydrotalea flava]|uniref:hypothetical protein n=1 Tax=Hydrotalea flava TaxID=714549 RepID=UPI0020A32229|nr:hypothetical protein [Hydrotalea flava]